MRPPREQLFFTLQEFCDDPTNGTFVCCCGLIALSAASAHAAVKPHGLFTDNAVLQQGMKLPVWGTTDKDEKITVSFEGQEVAATPKDGQWRAELAPLKPGGPFQMTITQGAEKLELKNLLVGDVWVCGGQSNMQWSVKATAGGAEAIAASANDKIRLFTASRARPSGAPGDECRR